MDAPPFTEPSPDDWERQYEAITRGAGYFPWPERSFLRLRGPDAVTFAHNLCTNDVRRLAPGAGCEAFITSVQGKTLGHVVLFRDGEGVDLETVGGQGPLLAAHFEKYHIREKVEILDLSHELGEIVLAGEQSGRILSALGIATPPETHGDHRSAEISGHVVSVRRVQSFGAVCFHLVSSVGDVETIAKRLSEAGATPCARRVAEMVRVEQGWPLFGQDIRPENLPQEVNRTDKAISFTKGCYLGQETVARIDALGHVNRLLVGVSFPTDSNPLPDSDILIDGKSVGHITSVAYSPVLSRPLTLAYLRRGFAREFNTSLGPARVHDLPLAREA